MAERIGKRMTARKCQKILKFEIKLFWRAAGFLLLFLMPLFSYIIFETITGNLQEIGESRALLNILWIGAFYLFFFAFSGTSRIAVPVVSSMLFLLAVAEALVEEFRGTPIMVWDMLAIGTAMTVAENYVIELTDVMREAGIAMLWLNLLVMLFPARLRWWKEWLIGGIGFAGIAVGFVFYFYLSIVPGQGLEINMWEMKDTYQHQGYILVTAISMKYMVKSPPEGYSMARLEEIYEQVVGEEAFKNEADTQKNAREYPGKEIERILQEVFRENEESWEMVKEEGKTEEKGKRKSTQDQIQPVNLICIMNESLSDLRVVGDFSTNQEYFPYLKSLKKNTVRGNLCVPVFGAWTSNSEFEFLTGDSIALLPSGVIAYQFYVKPDTNS